MSSRNSPSPRRSTAPGSPYRRLERADNEDIFEIPAKNPSLDKLGKWRKATLALNATRRFRYTLRLKNGPRADIRVATQALRAVQQFKRSLRWADHEAPPPGFDIAKDKLVRMVADKQQDELRKAGGVLEVARKLRSDVENGIMDDAEEVRKRKDAYGENSYPVKTVRNFFVFVWEACQDKTLIILMVCAVLSLALGIKTEGIKEGWLDGASILFAVFLVILVTAASDYKQSLQFMNLNEEKRNIQLNVVRGGRRMKISIFDVVVGDIVPLSIGDQVPADGLLINGHSLSIDESSMTGESDHVNVNQKNPFLKSGCKVADGYGTMLVTGVGLNTEWGLLMATISEDNQEETPLQVRLNGVATFIGKVGLSVAVVVFIVLLIRFFTGTTKDSEGSRMFQAGKTSAENAFNGVVKIFAIAVTIVVVAIPEGLPLAVTLTLAYSMRKMMADKALVRRLAACETMGSATTICSDKTGTLTMNQMTVVKVIVGCETKDPTDTKDVMNPVIQQLLIEGIAQNSTGSVFNTEGGGEHEVTGSPTEKAILTWALKLGMDFNAVRSKTTVLQVFTFNSEKKRGGVALRRETGEVHIHWKGAAEIILELCDKWIDLDGTVRSMTTEDKCHFNELVEGMAASALRCIAIAHRTIDAELVPRTEEELHAWQFPEESLTLLAFVGIKDPCRPNVKEAVILSRNAGVKVRMVTGDNLYTAKAIATECGILDPQQTRGEYEIIEGKDFRNFTEEKRDRIAERITVMGRSSPNDKLLFVQSLRRIGHIVAVTGDGTNDAPALHEADIGLSMGIQGTEVAKESSDIIILDDDFASVVKVVRWGRSVYANIQKFIQFQLTVNAAALVINFVAAVSAGDVPLTAVQLLWVNLIMDTLGALALATEAPTDHLMRRPPIGRKEPLVTNIMWRNLLIQALYQIVVLLTLQFRGIRILKLHHLPPTKQTLVKNTLIFNAFVLCQVFNEFNSRKPDQKNIFHGLFKSPFFISIISFTLVMQVMIIEFAGRVASTTKLTWQQWLICIVIGVLSWPLAVLAKMIPVPETPFSDYFNLERCKGSWCSAAKQNENQTEMSSV